jgi:hypothetical protein
VIAGRRALYGAGATAASSTEPRASSECPAAKRPTFGSVQKGGFGHVGEPWERAPSRPTSEAMTELVIGLARLRELSVLGGPPTEDRSQTDARRHRGHGNQRQAQPWHTPPAPVFGRAAHARIRIGRDMPVGRLGTAQWRRRAWTAWPTAYLRGVPGQLPSGLLAASRRYGPMFVAVPIRRCRGET